LNDFLSDEGIHHKYSSPYTPQQNGVAEQKNWTLIDMARTMLAEFKSPYNFWAKAINTACHASNWLYLCKGLNKTPYEILTSNKPNIKYFWVFSCKCYYLKKGVHLSKIDSKALEGTFVGYAIESHAFRFFDKESAHVFEVYSMRFNENDGSRAEQHGVFDVGDEIPPHVIRRMGVGHLIPIEEHLLVEGEGLCSTQVDPSPSQTQQAPQGPFNASPRQAQDPQPSEHDQDQDHVHGGDFSPNVDQDQAQDDEQAQEEEQAQDEGQGEDQNHGDDQVASQESLEESQA
jgi:hypothetical protein